MSMKVILGLLVALIAAVNAAKVPVTLFNSTVHPYARCLDGSVAGYYAQPAPNAADKTKFVIYLNGGGECDQEYPCKYQLTSALGSSKYFASEVDASGWFFASDYCLYNPTFCGWNHVYNPYCTQDLHSGQVKEATDKTWGMYFAGHHVMTAMLDEMDRTMGMKDATEIILSGASAGGIGVWMNVDYIAKRYPNARVTALTIAGFYFYATYYTGPDATPPSGMGDFRESAFPVTYDLYQAYVDQSCKYAMELKGQHPGACMLANNSFPYIEVDSFAIQALTDVTVLTGHDNMPDDHKYEAPEQEFMTQWWQNMTVGLSPLMSKNAKKEVRIRDLERSRKPKNGVFAAACYTHCGFNHAYPLLNGMNIYEAFGNFYFDRTGPEGYKLEDTCGLMCNPTCG